MIFPWRKVKGKVKSSSISQLVKEHVQFQRMGKRNSGSGLVVETGFPTSLVDLFVKNQEKFRKSRKKKKPHSSLSDPVIPPPTPPSSASVSASSTSLAPPSPLSLPVIERSSMRSVQEIVDLNRGDEGKNTNGLDPNVVMVAVLKMFFVVVLALGTKRLAVGITMSALFLLFLEYVGKHLYGFLKPCTGAQKRLRSIMQKVWSFICRTQMNKERGKHVGFRDRMLQEETFGPSCSAPNNHQVTGLIQETEMVQSVANNRLVHKMQEVEILSRKEKVDGFNSGRCGPNLSDHQARGRILEIATLQSVKDSGNSGMACSAHGVDGCSNDRRRGTKEVDSSTVVLQSIGELLEPKGRTSRRAKMKSKMKKLFSKKPQSSGKKGQNSQHDENPFCENKDAICGEQETGEEWDDRKLESDTGSLMSLPSLPEDGKDCPDAFCTNSELSGGNAEEAVADQDAVRTETKQNSAYLMLCVVVLVGLFGGRIFALLLTLGWCLIARTGGTMRRYIKVAFLRSDC